MKALAKTESVYEAEMRTDTLESTVPGDPIEHIVDHPDTCGVGIRAFSGKRSECGNRREGGGIRFLIRCKGHPT